MKKPILNIGKSLDKAEQKQINGGNFLRPGCYEYPTTDVDCISPWVYFPGCGFACKTAPVGP